MKYILVFLMIFSAVLSAQSVEPPIEFANIPLKTALEMVFTKAKVKYAIETDLSNTGTVALTLNRKTDLSFLFKILLEPRNLTCIKEGGVYKVRKPGEAILKGVPVQKNYQYWLTIVYDSECLNCNKMLENVKKMTSYFPDTLCAVECDIKMDKKAGEKYGVKIKLVDDFGKEYEIGQALLPVGLKESHPLPTVVLKDKTEKELYRKEGLQFEDTLRADLDRAGLRGSAPDPLKKTTAIGAPYYNGKSRVKFLSLPTGSIKMSILLNGKPIRVIESFKDEVTWDLKMEDGQDVGAGKYELVLDNRKGNTKTFAIEVLEKN